ncbi:uncharacterized protein LOC103315708 [Nasonia vitripennis]|uniref:Uncharacterized protein n=1 Tax=Nasonia vitripennis TaxID=7425 RepID=A0A7M7H315_NASVI|nr:uncharacterized protein LOC103315708 [Nasonia vitripennis]
MICVIYKIYKHIITPNNNTTLFQNTPAVMRVLQDLQAQNNAEQQNTTLFQNIPAVESTAQDFVENEPISDDSTSQENVCFFFVIKPEEKLNQRLASLHSCNAQSFINSLEKLEVVKNNDKINELKSKAGDKLHFLP